jgi:carbon dioxide concentrating mechanism protein CcmN
MSVYLPPLQAMHDSQVYISGDVTIHPNAAIASGVLLQASPGASIVVAAGACIGMGAVLHACEGTIEIQEGASLGAGVLIVGAGTIGPGACIGSLSTLLNTTVDEKVMVPSGSILGDRSRQLQPEAELPQPVIPPSQQASQLDPSSDPWATAPTPAPANAAQSSETQTNGSNGFKYPEAISIGANPFKYPEHPSIGLSQTEQSNGAAEKAAPEQVAKTVHGQSYVNDLLSTLLPNRNSQMSPSPNS